MQGGPSSHMANRRHRRTMLAKLDNKGFSRCLLSDFITLMGYWAGSADLQSARQASWRKLIHQRHPLPQRDCTGLRQLGHRELDCKRCARLVHPLREQRQWCVSCLQPSALEEWECWCVCAYMGGRGGGGWERTTRYMGMQEASGLPYPGEHIKRSTRRRRRSIKVVLQLTKLADCWQRTDCALKATSPASQSPAPAHRGGGGGGVTTHIHRRVLTGRRP